MTERFGAHLDHLTPAQLRELDRAIHAPAKVTTTDTRIAFREAPLQPSVNPMTRVYGLNAETRVDADGRRASGPSCEGCQMLVVTIARRSIFKCWRRGLTHGPGTDHRKGWPACGLYAEREGPPISAWEYRDRQASTLP